MLGMDISSYQGKMDLSKGAYDFAIIKATEGIGFQDRSFPQFAVQLTKLNKLIGCYHFARPDLNGTVSGMEKEAEYFCKVVEDNGLLNKAIMVLDWETEPMDREDLVEAWLERVMSICDATPFIYGSKSKLNGWRNWKVLSKYPLWVAAWPSITRYEVGKDPLLPQPTSFPEGWEIWQYSSTGKYPGFSGNVDLDMTTMDEIQWRKYAGSTEIISPDMQWAIKMGLFRGYGDGTFRPDSYLTREQAATVFRRFYNDIMEEEVK